MLTIFSTPKPFRGHIGIIQRNAIRSWTLLHPDVEVILFGAEAGAAEVAREFGIHHETQVDRNEHGTPYLRSIFDRAQDLARYSLLCYVNCDILLMPDFREALERVSGWRTAFLMMGRRWDTNITNHLDFSGPHWHRRLRALALREGRQRPPQWVDYFAFTRGLYSGNIPPLVIGRPGFDNWLVWKARASRAAVVDASAVVLAVHQNHDYSHHPGGEQGVWQGEEAQKNLELLGGGRFFGTMENATHRLTPDAFERNHRHWLVQGKRACLRAGSQAWFAALRFTRPIRHLLGLRQRRVSGSIAKNR